ncbi:MAG: tripartite tricarboxylate transporter substrate binding protein [Limnohabitans sp.]|nr:tripartite tricarboxylate transporter substrate binding protein [Limnohabitans sp.]
MTALHTALWRKVLPLLLAPMAVMAQGDGWPNKPVKMIVPINAGGGTADPLSRVLSEELGKVLGQRVVIENRGGSNGNIGATAAAKSPNDGYTVLFAWAGTLATNISLYKSLPFHPVNDFDPVVLLGGVSNILVVNNSFPARNLKEFTEQVRSHPGRFNYASSGNGSSMHLAAELFKKQTQTFIVHVPYNNVGNATGDLITNQVQFMFHLITGAQGAVKSGQVRPIAVLAPQRSPVLPDVPTMKELGFPIESQTWFALLFPKGAPAEAITKLNQAVNKLLADPAVRQRFMGMGLEPAGGSPDALAKHLDSEIRKWADVVKYSGASVD